MAGNLIVAVDSGTPWLGVVTIAALILLAVYLVVVQIRDWWDG